VGIVIERAYQLNLLNAVESRLQAHIYTLLTVAELEDGELRIPDLLAETRFNQFDSGLYAFVLDSNSQLLWQSKSFQLLNHVELFTLSRDTQQFVQFISSGEQFNALGQGFLWQGLNGQTMPVTLWVLEDNDYFLEPLTQFRWILWSGLVLVAVLLHFGLWALMYWALRPLKDLARDVHAIEIGELEALPANYPREVRVLSQAFNHMLEHERRQLNRYKSTLADLAHSLKTPLSVIKALLDDPSCQGELRHQVTQQLTRLNQSVSYHLKRPIHQPAYLKQSWCAILPCAKRLTNALSKVYAEKKIVVTLAIKTNVMFPGQEDDLFELLGNLIENGFKYGDSRLQIFAHESTTSGDGNSTIRPQRTLTLGIADDGAGVPVAKRLAIMQRGVRLDAQAEGQGLGLALVNEIVDKYTAKLTIETSELGGALFKLEFVYTT